MDVIVLAGGEGRRLGGVDKASLELKGKRFIDHVLADLGSAEQVIVVSPRKDLHLPPQVLRCSEEPPLGGPVAGIAAAMPLLSSEQVGIIAVDAPYSARSLGPLAKELLAHPEASLAAIENQGFLEPLCALWRYPDLVEALAAIGDPRDQAARRLLRLAPREVVGLAATGEEEDVDTADELEALRRK